MSTNNVIALNRPDKHKTWNRFSKWFIQRNKILAQMFAVVVFVVIITIVLVEIISAAIEKDYTESTTIVEIKNVYTTCLPGNDSSFGFKCQIKDTNNPNGMYPQKFVFIKRPDSKSQHIDIQTETQDPMSTNLEPDSGRLNSSQYNRGDIESRLDRLAIILIVVLPLLGTISLLLCIMAMIFSYRSQKLKRFYTISWCISKTRDHQHRHEHKADPDRVYDLQIIERGVGDRPCMQRSIQMR